ncbi:hypothetical protein [Pseudoalteromonas sp. GB43]
MDTILNIATLLGGITALWFLYDKRVIIFNWFRLFTTKSVNPLSLPDQEFEFIFNKAEFFANSEYLPVTPEEDELCKSLVNHGVLKEKNGTYKLTNPRQENVGGFASLTHMSLNSVNRH